MRTMKTLYIIHHTNDAQCIIACADHADELPVVDGEMVTTQRAGK